MRKHIFIIITFLVTLLLSQHKVVVSQVKQIYDKRSLFVPKSLIREKSKPSQINCSTHATLGFPPNKYIPFDGAGLSHRQVHAMRFEPPANGTIDSVYFLITPTYDGSTIQIPATIRIFKSNISPNETTGVYLGNYLPWGYYLCTDDYDMGITPYKDEATDTNWISTNADSTWDPLGEELWGLGGFPLTLTGDNNYHVIGIDLEESLGYKPYVEKDKPFFICIRNLLFHKIEYIFVCIGSTNYGDSKKPWRFWSFGEHDFPPWTPKGWVGLNFGNLNIWYTMTLNYPYPEVIPFNEGMISGKLEWEDIRIELLKFCASEYLDSAGIAGVWMDYNFNKKGWNTTPAVLVGDTMYAVTLPGQAAGTLVELNCRIVDSTGIAKEQYSFSYTIAGLSQNGYIADTAAHFDWIALDTTNFWISYDYFRLRTTNHTSYEYIDDGTAGPFDIGFDFNFFDKPTRYAFIGINGGMALGETIYDTLHLNSNDFFGYWDIPSSQIQPAGMPKNFIAPMWLDFKLLSEWFTCDSGKIFVKNEPNRFIVQWANLGNYINDTDCTSNFEVILDNSDSSVTFLYESVGWSNLARYATIGFEQDTTRWFKLYGYEFPEQFIPHNRQAIKFKRRTTSNVRDEKIIPVEFMLYQNYPNPFNSSTVIDYVLPNGCFVTLSVYNMLGEEVALLVHSYKESGHHSETFQTSDLPSGVYYYRISASRLMHNNDFQGINANQNFIDYKKMILIK